MISRQRSLNLHVDHLKTLLEYDQSKRAFIWLVGKRAGSVAGSATRGGCTIMIEGKGYRQPDLLVFYQTGVMPKRTRKRSPWRDS